MNDLLQKLALEAQKHESRSTGRRISLTKLIRAIQQSGQLNSKDNYGIPLEVEVYNQALSNTFWRVCHEVNSYNPEKATVMTWVNQLLDRELEV